MLLAPVCPVSRLHPACSAAFLPSFQGPHTGHPIPSEPAVPWHHFGSFWGTRTLQSVFWFLVCGPCCVQRNDSSTAIPSFPVFYSFFSLSIFFFLKQTCSSLHVYSKKHSSKQISVQHLQIQSSGSSTSRFTATHISTAVVMAIAERFS